MTTLVWDRVTERTYQKGLDRGVLYLQKDGEELGVVWNGLTSVDETSEVELTPHYLDGAKYLIVATSADFSGKMQAVTYPDELDELTGAEELSYGVFMHEQTPKNFNLSYRTGIGEDGYKIHLLSNVFAQPQTHTFTSIGSDAKPVEFSWNLTTKPQSSPEYLSFKPTAHISVDSTKVDESLVKALEDILYGTSLVDPHFPSIEELALLFGFPGALIIRDNGDGTWMAIDVGGDFITMLSETSFQINSSGASVLDVNSYEITTTLP